MEASSHHPPQLFRRLMVSGVLFGVGLASFIDETVLHQLLHWHHFYDRSTTAIGLVSDGLFHAFGWFAVVAGLFLYADVRRRGGPGVRRWWAPVLAGLGAFQAYDGVVQHKVMQIHQIRYDVVPSALTEPGPYRPVADILVYDTVWMVVAVLALGVGAWGWRRGARRERSAHAPR